MTLNYKSMGQGPALIILHGLFGSLDNWLSLGKILSEDFTVYLLDQRNHGRSPHDQEWNYEVMAQDLYEFIDSQAISKAHLLGHSMGGKTVMQFAGLHPEHIDKLIVADMAPIAYEPHHTQIINSLVETPVSEVASRQEADQYLSKGISQESVRQFLLKGLARNPDGGYKWRFNLDVISQDYANVLAAIEVEPPYEGETLFVYGGRSNYVVPNYQEEILSMFPNADWAEIPQAGHWLHAESPREFIEVVRNYLS